MKINDWIAFFLPLLACCHIKVNVFHIYHWNQVSHYGVLSYCNPAAIFRHFSVTAVYWFWKRRQTLSTTGSCLVCSCMFFFTKVVFGCLCVCVLLKTAYICWVVSLNWVQLNSGCIGWKYFKKFKCEKCFWICYNLNINRFFEDYKIPPVLRWVDQLKDVMDTFFFLFCFWCCFCVIQSNCE